jgi:hypothetical protein
MLPRPSFLKGVYRGDAKIARFLSVLGLSGVSFGLYRGIQDNYLAEMVHITAFERGIVEFFRETPGLLVVLLLAGSGKFAVVLFMVIYSCGEHIIMPVRTTMSLDLADKNQGGASLGITGALGHIGNIIGFMLVSGIFLAFSLLGFRGSVPFKTVFAVSAAPPSPFTLHPSLSPPAFSLVRPR